MRPMLRLRWWWGSVWLLWLVACTAAAESPTPTPAARALATAPPAATTPTAPAVPTATPEPETALTPPPESPWLDLNQYAFRFTTTAEPQVAEVWDFVAGDTYYALDQALYVPGGDAYAINLYERPFTPLQQDAFWPDLDIQYARLARDGPWMYALIVLYGLHPGTDPLTGEYGLELDLNVDGRGDLLLWARGPWSQTWSVAGVEVYADNDHDVGDAQACTSDAPHRRSNGYETLRWRAGEGDLPGAAWVRVRMQAGHPTIEFAFPVAWVAAEHPRLLWRAWADAQVHDPAAMDYHDAFTLEEAGQPYPGPWPLNAVAQADNTCYTTFGFHPTGLEPCLCRVNDPFHGLCPQPPGAPDDQCADLGAGFWSCLTEDQEMTICHWDPVFCRWDCRSLLLCPPVTRPEDLRAYLEDYLAALAESGSGAVAVSSETGEVAVCRVTDEGDLDCTQAFAEAWSPEAVTCVPMQNTWFCVGGEDVETLTQNPYFDLLILYHLQRGEVEAPTVRRWSCAWEPNLCRFECADEQWCLDPATTMREYVDAFLRQDPDCTFDEQARQLVCDYGQEEFRCDFAVDYQQALCTTRWWGPGAAGEISEATQWVYDPLACRFVQRQLCVRPELEGDCEPVGENEWLCRLIPSEEETRIWGAPPEDWEPPLTRCSWNDELCAWRCHMCEEPDDHCQWDEAQGLWVCPGRGVFDGCEWSVDECRWRCWGAHQPEQPEEEEECQPEDYCVEMVTDVYRCGDGKWYWHCVYDGCRWTCDREYP